MKSNTQNAKIEAVTENTLVVGIDVGSEFHYARAFDWRGIEFSRKPFKFSNTEPGFTEFKAWILHIQTEHDKDAVVPGMEPTGHYWFNLGKFLQDNGMKPVLVNPHHVKKSKELDDNNPTKNDRKEQGMKLKETGLSFQDIKDKVDKYMIETYKRFDFLAETARDQYIFDENGTPYLDFYAGIAVNSAGSCNEKVVSAVIDQVQDIMHTFNYPYTIPQALLAEKICETLGMDKIFFQNSGTEANEAMIKMARKYGIEKCGPNKYHIVTAKMGFHGRTFGAMSATGQPGNGCQIGFGPMTYGFSYAPYNDLAAFKAACTENTIAIMVEPVQGEGGVHPATPEFLCGLREFCDENGMLLLIDEVQTGWCRTGNIMSYMNYGIQPDIVSMAKALGGGMPIGAICASAEVAKAFTPGSHGTTFGGHPVCCAAALAEVNELLDRDLAGNAKRVGDFFARCLEELPHVKEVRHQGLLVGVEFDDTISGVDVKHEALHRHLLITAIGAHTIRMIPPLIVTEEDCSKAVSILEDCVSALL